MNGSYSQRRALLVDLDDTLYDYKTPEDKARTALIGRLSRELKITKDKLGELFEESREAVKTRLGERGSAHSRLLYLSELAHSAGRCDLLHRVRTWERQFWRDFLEAASPRPGAKELLSQWRERGGKIAVVTDLVLEVQLWKLEKFGLIEHLDAVAASEEVMLDKPDTEVFRLAMARLSVGPRDCIVVGDNSRRDGGGAQALGLPFIKVDSDESLARAAEELLE